LNRSFCNLIENDFNPNYEVSEDKKKVVAELIKLTKASDIVWLATDEDREGEAISWHLYETLGLEKKETKLKIKGMSQT